MEKQTSTNNYNQNVPPLGAGTSTSSGVTVFDPSATNNNNTPPLPPPSYDQAMGNNTAAPTAATTHTYNTNTGWSAAGATHTTTTTYTTYGPSVTTQQPPRIPQQQPAFIQPPPVVIIQPSVLPLGPEPVYITCPVCHVQKLTKIEYEPSSRTHLMAALLCLVGLWCCVCLPYCAGSCMNTHHYCGNCGKFLGTYGNAL